MIKSKTSPRGGVTKLGRPRNWNQWGRLFDHEEAVLDDLASLMKLGDIAAKYGVSRRTLSRWMSDESRSAKCMEARRLAADAVAERMNDRAIAVLERAVQGVTNGDEVAATRLAMKADEWWAGMLDRDRYAPRGGGAQVSVNIGALHLDSLRQAPPIASERPVMPQTFDTDDVTDVELCEAPPTSLRDLM